MGGYKRGLSYTNDGLRQTDLPGLKSLLKKWIRSFSTCFAGFTHGFRLGS